MAAWRKKKKATPPHPTPNPNIAHNCIDIIHLSGGFGLDFDVLNARGDLSVCPEKTSAWIFIFLAACVWVAGPSPPLARQQESERAEKQEGVALGTAAVWL